MADVRRRAEHDRAAQNPGSTVTIDALDDTVRRTAAAAPGDGTTRGVHVDVVVEYTVRGQQHAFDA